ncbi:radical SAM protein [Sphingomonas arantia]|uniref:Radical SAM protein n=1 Tax=Sphingomonas arantia TaxID=1460676 RepID=A0ABW4U0L4_9SPHN
MAGKRILLIEPGYKNKYPPLGLMKIAQYHGPNGKNDHVTFVKGEDPSVLSQAWDRIYVTTLFSFEYPKISTSIDYALKVANGQADKVFVGGIAASLMHERFLEERRWQGVRFIKGLLTGPPAKALQLDDFSEELYSDDYSNTAIEDLVPDYSILSQIDYEYPVRDAYFAYTSRGCIRKCHFCGVPKLEGMQRDVESLTDIVRSIDEMYGPKKDLILMDNNVVASPRFKEIIAEIRDLGFTPGAKLTRPGSRVAVQRRVDFNQGVDARILCKDPMYLRELATICLKPLRIAFDHLGVRKPYEQAVRYAHEHGLTELSNYMLYNFHDDPADLFARMRLNVTLNEELNIRVWSFPMRYQPTNRPDRGHIGDKWSRFELRSMQIILQATHGVVSGEPTFFRRAFGDTVAEYETILMMPHDMIFNRDWYDKLDGRGEYDQYLAEANRLSPERRHELKTLLSSCDPRHYHTLPALTDDEGIRSILQFYMPRPKDELMSIWRKQAEWSAVAHALNVPEDERVEDAGLDAEEEPIVTVAEPARARKAA